MANELITSAGTRALAADAAVGDEIAQAGAGFGELVEHTGAAVAATQNLLNETGSRTATALAETLVDVIAVQEKVYRDDGTLDTSVAHTRQLPLISFIDPVFYQWSSVRLQGRFYAQEFAATSDTHTYSSSSSFGYGNAGFGIVFGVGYMDARSSSTTTDINTEVTRDSSWGQMRMNALLEPREDVTIPKPNQVIRGPRLTLIQGAIEDDIDGGTLVGRSMSMLIQYNRRNGDPIANKAISVETNGVSWSFAGGPTAVTDADGQVEITLRRDFLGDEPDVSPGEFIVSARIGLVQNSVGVTF
ncbi:MAG: hypothetical protein QNJ78_12305 [Gammaproteobacteria bacterium]|nr:hypothetical protein [Gammaproteobacteria bacterium]